MPLLTDPKAAPLIARWACERLDHVDEPAGYSAIGITDASDTKLIGAVLYTDHRPKTRSIEMWAVGEGNWLTHQKIRALFEYPFVQLGCNRVMLKVARANKTARAFVKKLGFVEEGKIREGIGPGKDMMIYGMLRRECRWIGGEHNG